MIFLYKIAKIAKSLRRKTGNFSTLFSLITGKYCTLFYKTKLPEGVKDLDQMIKERGVERTQALLSSSSDNQLLFKDMDDNSIRANDLVAKTESKEQSKDVEIKGLDVGKDSVKIKEEELEI